MTDKRDRLAEKEEPATKPGTRTQIEEPVEVALQRTGVGGDGLAFTQLGDAAQAVAITAWREREKEIPGNPLPPDKIDLMSDTEVRQVIIAEGHRYTVDGTPVW
jgi:hypothetical protein